jgi:hypothetical protein
MKFVNKNKRMTEYKARTNKSEAHFVQFVLGQYPSLVL